MSEFKFKVGDLFTVDPALYPAQCHGVVYRVESLPKGAKGVNYVGKPADGEGRGVRAPEYAMRPHDASAPAPEPTIGRPYVPLPEIATIVRVHGIRNIDPHDLYVVTGYPQRRVDAVRLIKVGGENGRYWKAVPLTALEVIEPSRIKVEDA